MLHEAQRFGTPAEGFDFEQLDISASAAITLTAAKYAPTARHQACRATIGVDSVAVRARWDGVAPTTAVGVLYASGSVIIVEGNLNISQLELISTSGAGKINVMYERF
jgi:hypothetical protein